MSLRVAMISLFICTSVALAAEPATSNTPSSAPMYQAISHGEIAGTYQAFPDACRLKNGDIMCVFYAGYGHVALPSADYPKGGKICYLLTSDEGATWTKPAVLFDDEDDNRDAHIAQLDDGSLICTFFSYQ